MTKRIVVSIFLLLTVLCMSVTSYIMLQHRLSALSEAVENAIYTSKAEKRSVDEIEQVWKKGQIWFQIYLLHSDLTDLQTEILSLRYLTDLPSDYYKSCVRCLHLLNSIRDNNSITLGNIL